jgi:hypothetical protein
VRHPAKLLLALGIAAVVLAPVDTSAQGRQRGPGPERQMAREAPESLHRFVRELPPGEQRAVRRRLRSMDPGRRQQFFERWQDMSESERIAYWEGLRRGREARKPRQALPRELREEFRGMSAEERQQAREVLRRLPPERRARFYRAIQHWDELTPEQRAKVHGHVQRLRRFSEEQRERIERNRPAWENMNPVERDQMRRRLEVFRSLSPGRQEALVEQRFPDRTPEQRARILDRLRAR